MFPRLLRPTDGLVSHGCSASDHGCLLPTEVHSVLVGHWAPAVVETSSSGNASPSGPALHSGSIICLLLALGLSDCSDWLLGQEDEVPDYSASGTDFLLTGCSSGTAANAEGTVSGTAAEADTSPAADIPKGDSA